MLGAILTIAVLVAIGTFGCLLFWKAGETDDRAEREQREYMNGKEEHISKPLSLGETTVC